jgi:hypothetical protein
MSVRTGVFIKYVLEFPGLKLSNDLLAGDMCIDADITVSMARWTSGTTFTITLYDLPEANVKALADSTASVSLAPLPPIALGPPAPPRVKIKLGYFDTATALVVDGVYESVESSVSGDKLVTTVKGREAAVYACKKTPFTAALSGDVSYAEAVKSLLSSPKLPPNCVDATPNVNLAKDAKLRNPKFTAKTVLQALDEIARRANAELMIVDGKVFLGAPIRYDDATPAPLDYASTLAKFDPLAKLNISGDETKEDGKEPPEKTVKGFQFTAVGDPTMRPGQSVTVNKIKDYAAASPPFRIRDVKHVFSSTSGYSVAGNATEQLEDGVSARRVDSAIGNTADTAARDLVDKIRSQAADNPVVEVAAVKAAADNYRTDLYYGQSAADGGETQPSVNVAVDQGNDRVYLAKPIASAFAWNRCGLVTPVYPGMKAVVVHNRASASDGIVAGYIWSKQPDFAPPDNHQGDWWLCLPIDVDATHAPDSSTNAANDLIANNGKRVIEVKGLKISVGSGKLAGVGKRPTEGGDDELLIEHSSGTKIHIDSTGALTIDASAAPLTINGSVVIQGSLEIK